MNIKSLTSSREDGFRGVAKNFVVVSVLAGLPFAALAETITFDNAVDNVPFFSFDSNDADTTPDVIFSTTHPEGFANAETFGAFSGLQGSALHVSSTAAPDLRLDFLRGAVGSLSFNFASTNNFTFESSVGVSAFAADGSLIGTVSEFAYGFPGDFDPTIGFDPVTGDPCDPTFDIDCVSDSTVFLPSSPAEGFASLNLNGQVATFATLDFGDFDDTSLLDNFSYNPSSSDAISSFMGALPDDPIFGDITTDADGNPSFEFDFSVTEGGLGDFFPIFIDPDVAVGYDYTSNNGNPFSSVVIPDALANGDMDFTLVLPGFGSIPIAVGDSIDLLAIDPNGFTEFSIVDIDTSEALDPNDIMAFVTGLTFVNAGAASVTQAPIVVNTDANVVPAPSGLALLAAGLAGMGFRVRRQQKG